jgi:hypothetical protein
MQFRFELQSNILERDLTQKITLLIAELDSVVKINFSSPGLIYRSMKIGDL